ncbi:MAG: hypothetical protein PHY54_11415 [Methylococcales bacterium]|nr:hypothetical protein [Methylococcales bacterium]
MTAEPPKNNKKEERKESLALASREYYRRMKIQGYKKYGILIKESQMVKLGIVAEQLDTSRFELLEVIIGDYLKALSDRIENVDLK